MNFPKINLSQKDKSLLMLVSSALILIWAIYSLISYIFFSTTFGNSDIKKVISNSENKQWYNISKPLETKDVEGRLILLDFWTFACVNCIQSIPEIKKIEDEFGSKVTVIGVHSGKFDNEKDVASIRKAILKYDITHPVINDSDFSIWNAFKVNSWPTMILINPNGREVKRYVGEDEVRKIHKDVKKLVSKFDFRINRDPLPTMLEKNNVVGNVLSFPTKLKYVSDFLYKSPRPIPAIFIANSGQNNIVVSKISGDIILKIGSGKKGFEDGDMESASFNSPRGLLYDSGKLYVADTGNHALRVVDFKNNKVETLLGFNGQRGDIISDSAQNDDAKNINLASPSDIEFFPNKDAIAIANSGTHQILSYNLKTNKVSVLAGNGNEGIDDGKYPQNSLAQTEDMAVYSRKLYFVDSESSSLRVLDENGNVKTLIGTGLFDFGSENGDKSKAKMQHPLGLFVDDTGAYISDSFNHKIKRYDLSTNQINNFVGSGKVSDNLGAANKTDFDQPEGIISILNNFYVADSNNNRVVIIGRENLNSHLLNVMPALKFPKEGFLQYMPNLAKSEPAHVKKNSDGLLKINIKDGWKINELGPSFINLLDVQKKSADLIAVFDWQMIKSKELKLPKLDDKKNYVLQGTIYYCEDKKDALCYIKSYEQQILVDDDKNNKIEFNLP